MLVAPPVLTTHVTNLDLRCFSAVVGRRLAVMESQHRDTVDIVAFGQGRHERAGRRLDATAHDARLEWTDWRSPIPVEIIGLEPALARVGPFPGKILDAVGRHHRQDGMRERRSKGDL